VVSTRSHGSSTPSGEDTTGTVPGDIVADERDPGGDDYRLARKISAGVLIALVSIMVIGDVLSISRPVEPATLVALLLAALGLLSVDAPGLRR